MSTIPGCYDIPAIVWSGAMWPGKPWLAVTAAEYTMSGTFETFTYIAYIDVQAGHTLLARPGGTYQIAPAGQGYDYGSTVPPPDGLWAAADGTGYVIAVSAALDKVL